MSYIVTGVKEINEVLAGLPLQVNHRILQQANTEAAKMIVNQAKLEAPEGPTGGLIDSIGTIKPSISASEFIGETHTGPRRGRFKGHHAHLVHDGTKQRNYKGADRGRMTPNRFMQRAFDKTNARVLDNIEVFIGRKLLAFMRRTIKRVG